MLESSRVLTAFTVQVRVRDPGLLKRSPYSKIPEKSWLFLGPR